MTVRRSGIPDPLREDTLVRDGFECQRCGMSLIVLVTTGDYSLQHRNARGMGGTRRPPRPCELVLLCGSATTGCHGWVEANPDAARVLGYRVPPGVDPSTWPVRRADGRTWLLTDEGWLRPAEEATTA